MPSFAIHHDEPVLDLRDYNPEMLRKVVESRGTLLWNLEGTIRRIPTPAVANILQEIEDWDRWKMRRPHLTVPETIGKIEWDAAYPLLHSQITGREVGESMPSLLPIRRTQPQPPATPPE